MTQGMKVKRGTEYLPKCPLCVLEQIHQQLGHGKARQRVWATIQRKRGMTCEAIGNAIGEKTNTVHNRLKRLTEGGMCSIYDTPSPGGPASWAMTKSTSWIWVYTTAPKRWDTTATHGHQRC